MFAEKFGTEPNRFSKNGIAGTDLMAVCSLANVAALVDVEPTIPCNAMLRRKSSSIPAAVYQSIPDFGSVKLFGIITSRDTNRLRPSRPIYDAWITNPFGSSRSKVKFHM